MLRVDRLGGVGVEPEALCLGIGLDQGQVLLVAPREAQVVERHLVDREHGARGPVLGAHVADGRPGLERQGGHARPVALHERPHHAVGTQQLGDGEDHVGGGDPGLGLAGEPQADHGRQEHGQGLAQHGRLRLDAAHAPAQDAQPIDHDGVGVGTDQGVAEGAPVRRGEDQSGQVLEVDLMADASPRRHHLVVPERSLGPAQELVALEVPPVLDRHVLVVRRRRRRTAR